MILTFIEVVGVSMRKDGSFFRKERMTRIKNEIAKHMPNGVSYEKILKWAMYEMGLTRQKAEEYLQLVIEMEEWDVKDGKIVPLQI